MRTRGHLLVPITCVAARRLGKVSPVCLSLGACEWVAWELGTTEDSYRDAELLPEAEK